jgi:uncharacterized RDD family membrane protein YckC
MSEEAPGRSGLEQALRAPVRAALGGPSRALTTAVAERVAEILIEEGVVERTVERALRDPSTERAAVAVLDSELLDELTRRLLTSEEIQQVIERIAGAPEVRNAITRQGVGLLDDLRRELVEQSRNADAIGEAPLRAAFRRPRRERPFPVAGIVTRLVALVIDGAIVNFSLLGISALLALLFNQVTGDNPSTTLAAVTGVAAWIIFGSLYLTSFWSLTGATPGMRFMSIELRGSDGRHIGFGRGLRRIIGMVLGAIPAFAGYLAVMVSSRRHAFHDRLADTEVLYTADKPQRGSR